MMTERAARTIAAANSTGEAWVVWKDYSDNEQIKASRYEDWLNVATAADEKIAIYEDGEQTA